MIHTPTDYDPAQSEIMAFQPAVLAGAIKLSGGDHNEAHHLTHLTFLKALETPRKAEDRDLDLRLWLFSVMRSVFHSVERQRRRPAFAAHRLALPGHGS